VLYGLTSFTLFGLILLFRVLTLNISRQVLKMSLYCIVVNIYTMR